MSLKTIKILLFEHFLIIITAPCASSQDNENPNVSRINQLSFVVEQSNEIFIRPMLVISRFRKKIFL